MQTSIGSECLLSTADNESKAHKRFFKNEGHFRMNGKLK